MLSCVCVSVCMYVCVCMYMYMCVCVCVCVFYTQYRLGMLLAEEKDTEKEALMWLRESVRQVLFRRVSSFFFGVNFQSFFQVFL
jgi:hypothetical protein